MFFFNDTATTEIYTYVHTLSLHDALPIYGMPRASLAKPQRLKSAQPSKQRRNARPPKRQRWQRKLARQPNLPQPALPRPKPNARLPATRRSEEHTSELQSLMRISYAVFCLKKKKQQTHKYYTEDQEQPTAQSH